MKPEDIDRAWDYSTTAAEVEREVKCPEFAEQAAPDGYSSQYNQQPVLPRVLDGVMSVRPDSDDVLMTIHIGEDHPRASWRTQERRCVVYALHRDRTDIAQQGDRVLVREMTDVVWVVERVTLQPMYATTSEGRCVKYSLREER